MLCTDFSGLHRSDCGV